MQETQHKQATSGDLKRLWAAVFFLFLGFGLYSACSPNFATDIIKISPMGIGIVEAVRELPGFLCVFVAALTMRIVEPVLGAIAVTLMAIGVGAYATVMGVPSLLAWSFVWSLGMHAWMPISSSLTLNLSDKADKGKRMGQTAAFGGVGTVLGMLAVRFAVHHNAHPGRSLYQIVFTVAGLLILVGAAILMTLRRDIAPMDKPRMVWKWEFCRYYVLSMLEGGRKQVFFTFAPYTLTKVFHAPVRIMAMLMVINAIVGIIGAPLIGRLIDRVRERRILLVSYSLLILVFALYGSVHLAPKAVGMPVLWVFPILCVLYCLDNLLYLSTLCLTTYVQRIAGPEDLMPTLSMGVTMNHVAAVLVPLIGGYLWMRFSYPIMFVAGGIVVLLSIFFVHGMREPKASEAQA